MSLFVRAGPAAWNKRAFGHFLELGRQGHAYGGVTMEDRRELHCPDEETVFQLLGWDWVAPEDRR